MRLVADESVVGLGIFSLCAVWCEPYNRCHLGGRILVKLKANTSKPLPAHRFGTGDIVALRPSKLPDRTPATETGAEPSGIVYRAEEVTREWHTAKYLPRTHTNSGMQKQKNRTASRWLSAS